MLKKFKLKPIKLVLNGKTINLTGDNINIDSNNFSVDEEGNVVCSNIDIKSGNILLKDKGFATELARFFIQNDENPNAFMSIMSGQIRTVDDYGESEISPQHIILTGKDTNSGMETHLTPDFITVNQNSVSIFYADAKTGEVFADSLKYKTLSQYSLENLKKNIRKYDKEALKIVKSGNIYSYNFKTEKDTDKKHIGFIIGSKYKTSTEILTEKGDGIDMYSMCSLMWKAIQELSEKVEQLQKEVKELKGGQNK